MLRIGILEDEKARSDELLRFLERYRDGHGSFSYSVKVYETGGKLLFDYRQDYDLLFMDIRLPDMLGIDAARENRKIDQNVMIVFVTNLTQYAIDGYEVNAFDCILKPLLYQPFELKLTRIVNILDRAGAKKMLTLKTKQLTFRLDAEAIVYVEVSGHNLIFHTLEREYRIWGTLSKIEQELEGGRLFPLQRLLSGQPEICGACEGADRQRQRARAEHQQEPPQGVSGGARAL